MKKTLYILLTTLSIISCQQDVFFDLPEYQDKVVIYSLMRADTFPGAIVTRSVSIYEPRNYEELGISDATVILTGTDWSDTLKTKDSIPKGVYFSLNHKIKHNETYTLTVQIPNEKTYIISTKVPEKSTVDSVRVKKISNSSNGDSVSLAYFYFKPPARTAYYSVHYFRVSSDKTPSQVNPDEVKLPKYEPFTDGLPFRFVDTEIENRLYIMRRAFEKGDTVKILFRHINLEYYDYLRTSLQNSETGEPVRIISNIPGGLGVFGGFSEEEVKWVF
ncbi:MAG: hypothetical protein A3H98_11815 [Bacteroidetes bacterium RIFCSPLOWO2_02_FULL_36_8]|nr:MAG: hypothetical protein A3H98_11815 [Bacteroidetes bacterium RIFCSPLOWO2_02_FULL_36_8]OFY69447.1 MAG: hypothetical protein A3G23_00835 [Bacteroidetes bacterium RIFCSPLOWO2_12_FULL_37_12]